MKSNRITGCSCLVVCLFASIASACVHNVTISAECEGDTIVCVGDPVKVKATAHCNPSQGTCTIVRYSWSAPGGEPNSQIGESNEFSCSYDATKTGTRTIQVTATCGGGAHNQASVQVTVVGVGSVATSKDHGCVGQVVTFTAIADPNGPLDCLQWQQRRRDDPNEPWSAWVTGSLSYQDMDPNDVRLVGIPGYYQLRARNGSDPNSWIESAEVVVIKVETNPIASYICDGLRVDIDLKITPEGGKNHISNVVFVAVEPDGVTNYGNPSGEGLTFSQRGDITQWQIDNTRWYSMQPDHCNVDSVWKFTATFSIGSSHGTTNTVTFSASTFKTCIDGWAEPFNIWSGDIEITTLQLPDGKWQATITYGTFHRNVVATLEVICEYESQYYNMVQAEEVFHVGQYEGTTSTILNHLWNAQLVMADATATQPEAFTQDGAITLARNAFIAALVSEEYRSAGHMMDSPPHPTRCAAENEAKSAIGASYRLTMPCAYPECP